MTSDKFVQYGPFVPFQRPLDPPSVGADDRPNYALIVNAFWVPIITGALKVLLKDETWDTNDQEVLARVEAEAHKLLASWFLWESDMALPIGVILPYAGIDLPAGFLECDGAEISRTTYAALWGAIGNTFGDGDGVDTFNLPDMRSRFPLGHDQGEGLTHHPMGAIGGEEAHQLTIDELPAHSHGIHNVITDTGAIVGFQGRYTNVVDTGGFTTQTGGDDPHNTMPPFLALKFIISAS